MRCAFSIARLYGVAQKRVAWRHLVFTASLPYAMVSRLIDILL